MILLLYGHDTYRSRRKLSEIIERYKIIHRSGMSFVVFDEEGGNFDTFKNAVQVAPMFGEKKLVVLKYYCKDNDFCKNFLSWEGRKFLKESQEAIAVFYEEGVGKGSALFPWLLTNSKHENFDLLWGTKLYSWARGYMAKHRINIEPAALTRLATWCKGDLWLFVNEAQKLKAYKGGEKIMNDDLSFSSNFSASNIFSLVDAVIAGDRTRAARALRERLEAGDDALQAFALVVRQFRIIAQVRSRPAPTKQIEAHPFVVKKAAFQGRRFNDDQIKKIYRMLVDLDTSMKIGKISPLQALEELIFEV